MGNLSSFYILYFAPVRCFFLSTALQCRVNWAPPVREATPWRDSFLHNFGHDMLYCLAFVQESPIRTFQSVWVSIWGQGRQFGKSLNGESNCDYEGTAAWKTHSAHSDKKKTLEFVGEIKTMIDNDPWRSARAIARDTGVSEFLIRETNKTPCNTKDEQKSRI